MLGGFLPVSLMLRPVRKAAGDHAGPALPALSHGLVLQFTFRVRSLHKHVSDGSVPVFLMPPVKLALVLSEGTCRVPFPCYF